MSIRLVFPHFRKKPKKRENGTGCRRSMRLQNVDPSGVSLPETPTQPTVIEDENVRKCKYNILTQ